MKKSISTILVLCILFLVSCYEDNESPVDSIYKADILSYFDNLKTILGAEELEKVEEFSNAIDFKQVKIYELETTEKIIIADVFELEAFSKPNKLKALFFVNQNKIVRSRIISFQDKEHTNEYDQLILAILNMNNSEISYSGRVSFYSVLQNLLLFNDFERGDLNVNGIARIANYKNSSGRTMGCIDWYLITTYYYSWGTRTSEVYLYTSCSCGEEAYRVNCADGGGGSGGASGSGNGPSLPANPQPNQEYEYTDDLGKYTLYKYSSVTATWQIVMVILPPAVIQTEPENYPFLEIIEWPLHNQQVFGTDNLIYTYDAYTGNWEGEKATIVISPDRPISNMADFLKCFDISKSATITIYVDQPKSGSSDAYALSWSGAVVGHTFVSITQGINTSVFGFYPSTDETSTSSPPEPSAMGDDSGDSYDISISVTVSGAVLSQILQYSINRPSNYDLDNYNCSDFGITIGNMAGLSLPDSYATWPGGGGSNPGVLGQHIRGRSSSGNITINKTSGNAPRNNKGC